MQVQIAVLDYGSQYSQLIVRRIRELKYFAKLYQPDELPLLENPAAIILSGGPHSVTADQAPDIDFPFLQQLNIPVLGVCYGMQLLNLKHKGRVEQSITREYGPASLIVKNDSSLFAGVQNASTIWMSHSDAVTELPDTCEILAVNETGNPVALKWSENFYGIQFHPEVSHTDQGTKILQNFLSLTPVKPNFTMDKFKETLCQSISEKVGNKSVVCGVSGGVDSTVLAVLLKDAGIKLHPILVDTGLLRKNEVQEIQSQFQTLNIDIEVVDAANKFLSNLAGITDPEEKRRRIGNLFLDIFFEHAGQFDILAQGTLYPDVIESATSQSSASRIKTHHNRVDRVLELAKAGKVIEPLAELFKDEVRQLGATLGVPPEIIKRHPFPGPGLAVRIPGEITAEKLDILREADAIYTEILRKSGWYDKIWQACATLLPAKTVGVKGDSRVYEYPLSLRAVISADAMTADWVEIPFDVLRVISNRILNEVPGIGRILYDISTKPPAGIEWE